MSIDALIEQYATWAKGLARRAKRKLPPSFDIQDLEQASLIGLWKAAQRFDPERGVPFKSAALRWVTGEIAMFARRGNYRHATADEISVRETDSRPTVEEAMLSKVEQTNKAAPLLYRRRKWLEKAIGKLTPAQAYVIRRVYLDGQDPRMLAQHINIDTARVSRYLSVGLRRLKAMKEGK